MEKAQIAKYALMQVTALVYSVLASGAAVKLSKWKIEAGRPLPDIYFFALFMRNYGTWLLPVIIGWTFWLAYSSSSLNQTNETPWSARIILGICFLLAVGSTWEALGAVLTSFS